MLLHMKRGLTAALILTLTLTLGVPALAADPLAGGGFAQVAISAKNSDSPPWTWIWLSTAGTAPTPLPRWSPWTTSPPSTV